MQQPLDHIAALEAQLASLREELALRQQEIDFIRHLVSHDLRAPLRSVDGFSRIIAEDYAGLLGDEGNDYLRRIHRAVTSMVKLLDDSLTLLRPIKVSGPPADVNLSSQVREIIAEFQQLEPGRRVEVVIADNLTAYSDGPLCREMLRYLLDNAWKFTSKAKHAKIVFDSLTKGHELVYFIKDSGAGFAMQHIDKLFQPFQRLHSSSQFPGNGIGLAMAQRIARFLNGRIWAEAEVDQGATFYFTLSPPR